VPCLSTRSAEISARGVSYRRVSRAMEIDAGFSPLTPVLSSRSGGIVIRGMRELRPINLKISPTEGKFRNLTMNNSSGLTWRQSSLREIMFLVRVILTNLRRTDSAVGPKRLKKYAEDDMKGNHPNKNRKRLMRIAREREREGESG
jgi:hypothetical protein